MKPGSILMYLLVLLLTGCASSRSAHVYSHHEARQEMYVRFGVLETIRPVELEGRRSGVGGMAGAVVGGVAGSHVGGGSGRIVGGVIGAVLGGLAGQAIEKEAMRRPAMELTVRMDDGQVLAVVQEGDPLEFRPGDRVRVLSGPGGSRVSH